MTAPERSIGVPALVPHRASIDPAEPAFTEQDVVDYLRAHPQFGGRRYHLTGPATIEAVEFLDAWQVETRLRWPIGTLGAALVCLVTLHGAFTFIGMRGMAPIHTTTGWLIFDVRSGNLLHSHIDLRT